MKQRHRFGRTRFRPGRQRLSTFSAIWSKILAYWISHDELLTALWRDVHVQPEVLKTHILVIRTVLGDDSSSPKFIETQRGRGYRFIGQMAGPTPPDVKPEAALDLGVLAGRAEPMRRPPRCSNARLPGEPQAVFISGEPGIGKTTLIEQFLLRAHGPAGFANAGGHCIEGFAGTEPYYPHIRGTPRIHPRQPIEVALSGFS